MNIYKHEFKMRLKSVITWSVSMTAFIFLYTSIFPAFAKDAELMTEMMSKFPKEFLLAFGMDGLDMSSVLGFFSFVFLFVQICLAIQASNYGFSLVSIEERELTADFLLAKPIGRPRILTAKLLAALTSLTITNMVIWISSFIAISLFRDGREYESRSLFLLLLSINAFQLFFLCVSMLISLVLKKVKSVTPLSMGLAFGMYVLNAFSGMLGDSKLEAITPFKHFDPTYIVKNSAYDTPLVLISVSAIVISVVGSYWLYRNRNIPSMV